MRWDAHNLYVNAEVSDPTRDAVDEVDIFVDQNNGKTGTYEADDRKYQVLRVGLHGLGFTASTRATDTGYRVEAAIPLKPDGAVNRKIGFDIRIRDASGNTTASWNDNHQGQDTDTSRWGTLSLIDAIRVAEVLKATPVVDGVVDRVWSRATSISPAVQLIGTGGATATVKLLYDSGHLYVLATVTDPTLDESSPNAFEQDSIEVFVDPDNSKNIGYNDDDGQYRISFTNHQTLNGNFNASGIADNLSSVATLVPGGYQIEASIELDTIKPANGSLIGFDLQVNDATAGTRTAARIWQDPTGLSYLNTSRWGVLQLSHPIG